MSDLENYIVKSDIDNSIRETVNLIKNGHYRTMWFVFFKVWSKYINCANVTLIVHIYNRRTYFNKLKPADRINDQELMNFVAQTVTYLCTTEKKEINLRYKPVSVKISDKTHEVAQKYVDMTKLEAGDGDGDGGNVFSFASMLKQFMEIYGKNKINATYYWINKIVTNKDEYKTKPCKIKLPKAICDHPSWIIWFMLTSFVEGNTKENKNLITILRKIYSEFLSDKNIEYASMILYIATNIAKYQDRIKHKELDFLTPTIIEKIMTIQLVQ